MEAMVALNKTHKNKRRGGKASAKKSNQTVPLKKSLGTYKKGV